MTIQNLLSGLAKAGWVFDKPEFVTRARKNTEFITENLI